MARRAVSDAATQVMEAQRERVYAENLAPVDHAMANISRGMANRKMQEVRRELTAGECAALGVPAETWVVGGQLVVKMRDTMQAPSAVAAAAQSERTQLAADAGCLDLALDTARSIQPTNSLERMLAHQLAAAHAAAMRLTASADRWLRKAETAAFTSPAQAQHASIEAARCTNAAARMMATYQDGMASLVRMRNGGQQTVTVNHQHVNVSEGGQAVVAGSVTSGKGKRRR